MRTKLITLALIVSAILSATLSTNMAFAYDKKALIESYFSIVMVRGYNDKGGMAYGSGVVIDTDKVITNCHVLRTTKKPWVSRGEDSYEITSVKADTWHDLCLVTTDGLPTKAAKIGKSVTLKRGQEVAGIGHSSGSPAPLTSQGSVNGLYAGNPGKVIRTNAKFLMGASGSGLFDLDGYLVGINTFKTAGKGGNIHFALPVEWIQTLEALPEIKTFPISGKALWEEDEDKKPFYMQAAVPESRYDWPKLAEVAERWTKAEPLSPDAWFALALSQEKMAKLDLANESYHHSLKLDNQNTDAWIKVGDLAKTRGDNAELNHVYAELNNIDKEIGAQYKQMTECTENC
jgi:hypothetical protein